MNGDDDDDDNDDVTTVFSPEFQRANRRGGVHGGPGVRTSHPQPPPGLPARFA